VTQVPAGSHGSVALTQKTLTSAQILDLGNTPVSLVPAQGAGTTIVPLTLAGKYHFVTAAYGNGSILDIGLASGGDNTNNTVWQVQQQMLQSSEDRSFVTPAPGDFTNWHSDTYENIRLAVTLGGVTAFDTGAGTLTLWVLYAVVTL
jgi:hypothetical protein